MASALSPLSLISFIVISISAIINSFLVYFASKIQPKSFDIKLIISIASIELIVPVFKAITTIYTTITGDNLIFKTIACQILGSLVNLIFFTELALSFLLANERLAKVTSKPLSLYFRIPFFIISMVFPILILWMAFTNEMTPYPSELTCFANPHKSILSAITFYYFLIYAYSTTFGMVYVYIKLSYKVIKTFEFVDLELHDTNNHQPKKRPVDYKMAALKVYIMVAFYASSMLVSFSFLLVCMYTNDSTLYMYKLRRLGGLITVLFFFIGITSNSVLLMTLHTGLSKEVTTFFKRFKRQR